MDNDEIEINDTLEIEPDIINDDERPNQRTTEPIILPIPVSLSQLMGLSFMNTPTDHENSLEEQIQQQSFHEQNKNTQVCTKDIINSLSVQKVNSTMINEGLTCSICLEELKAASRCYRITLC